MNELMRRYWEDAQGSEPQDLPPRLERHLDDLIRGLGTDVVEHIHVRDFGIRDRYLGHGLRVVRALFSQYRQTGRDRPLLAYVSLDDGSALIESRTTDGVPWFDCAVHFHVTWDSGCQWSDPNTIEEIIQPCLIVNSDDPLFIRLV